MLPEVSPRVLVVEDDLALLGLACSVLRREGYEVVSASDAEDAQRLAELDGPIDCLFTDVCLPGASGLDLAASLVRSQPGLNVVVTTAHIDGGYREEAEAREL